MTILLMKRSVLSSVFLSQVPPTQSPSKKIRLGSLSEKAPILMPPIGQRALLGLRSFGHRGRVLIKTDNEPAVLSLKEEMMMRLEVGVIPVESACNESESIGSVENGMKLFKGMLWVHLLALERKLNGNIPSQHPVWRVWRTS